MPFYVLSKGMAEPHPRGDPFRIHIAYSFDRLLEAKLTQAYEILVPCRERAVGVRGQELNNENGRNLCPGFVGAATRGEYDRKPDGVASRQSPAKTRASALRFADSVPEAHSQPLSFRHSSEANEEESAFLPGDVPILNTEVARRVRPSIVAPSGSFVIAREVYSTTKIKEVLCVRVAEPELKVPVTFSV
jgi:hypothetical protein